MKNTMVKISFVLAFAMFLTLSAQAQTTTSYRAEIPFDFTVGKQTFAAGKYVVEPANSRSVNGLMILRNTKNGKTVIFQTVPELDGDESVVSKLVFNRYGNQIFLAELVAPKFAAKFAAEQNEERLAKSQKAIRQTVSMK